ncbi:hypothetical protein ACIRPS_30940 [Streptomyces griseoviridis]
MGLWIGRPGYLREFTEAASTFDRSPDLSVFEFQSLAGGVTTWAAPLSPRRYRLAWSAMLPDDLAHLDRLARRVDGPGPVAVVDPASGNLLTANHASGTNPSPGQGAWSATANVTRNGTPGSPLMLTLAAPDDLTTLVYYGTTPALAYPVAQGQPCTFWAPQLAPVADQLRMWCYGSDGAYIRLHYTSRTDRPFTFTMESDVAYVRPGVKLARSFNALPVGPALFVQGTPAKAYQLGSRQAFDADQAAGRAPIKWTVGGTGAALSVSGGNVMVTFPNSGNLNWSPMNGTPGYPVTPGQTAVFTAAFSGADFVGMDFLSSSGSAVLSVPRQASVVPAGAAYVAPWCVAGKVTGTVPVGASSLLLWDAPPVDLPAGEGSGLFTVTNYSQSIRPGNLDSRDASIELVEVTYAAS